jgi:protoporphyrinogen oxidase
LHSTLFKTYAEKVWGTKTTELPADGAAEWITEVDEFRYPVLGSGQLWERVRDRLLKAGQLVMLGQDVVEIRHDGSHVVQVVTRDVQTGEQHLVGGSDVISTLPIGELVERCLPPLPDHVRYAASQLRYRDFLTVVVVVNRPNTSLDQWIYTPDPTVQVARIQNFKNWSPDMVPDAAKTFLGLEYWCFEGEELWETADADLVQLARRELAMLGVCSPDEVLSGAVVRQPKAYPVYDDASKHNVATVREYLYAHMPNLHAVGRNGMHLRNNQDHSMMTALLVARNIATGSTFNPWNVTTDADYHEDAGLGQDEESSRLMPMRAAGLIHIDK